MNMAEKSSRRVATMATVETVLSVTHYTDALFSFVVTRPAGFRFASGEFVMIGLELETGPLMRAYSVASPAWADTLEFYSIKVPDGPLTSRLQKIVPGDSILLGRKPTGTLVAHALTPAKRLYLLSTGTGAAPFASLVRDPEVYERFEEVILVQGCRHGAELAFAQNLSDALVDDPLIGEIARAAFRFVPCLTREPHALRGRVPELIEDGRLAAWLGAPALSPAEDRVMICGSPDFLVSTRATVEALGFREGTASAPGDYAIERAFVG